MDFKNVLIAIVLSTLVLVVWATVFEAPIVEQQPTKNEITKNEDLSSPSIDESKKEIKNEITRNDVINKTNRVKIENENIKGSFLGIKRILRCHPIKTLGGKSGYDPAPNLKKGKK